MAVRFTKRQFRRLTNQPAESKWGNKKTVVAGLKFDSKWESQHWVELRLRESAGEIKNLQRQVRIPVVINGVKVTTFIADFTYDEREARDALWAGDYVWKPIVSDCKSEATRLEPYYRLKKKLLRIVNGIDIREVVKPQSRRTSWKAR